MMSCVSVSLAIGILRWGGAASLPHHHSPTSAMQPAGQDPETRLAFGTVTVPLCSRTNASPFWIMLLLLWGRLGHATIAARLCDAAARWFLSRPCLQGSSSRLFRNVHHHCF